MRQFCGEAHFAACPGVAKLENRRMQSLSLEATLEAVASTVVDVLGVDIALIRMPDERREWLVPRAIKVASSPARVR